MSEGGDAKARELFLLDGLLQNSSPVVLVVADPSIASSVAVKLHSGSVAWDRLPAVEGRLLHLDTTMVAQLNDEQVRSLRHEMAATPDWFYMESIDELLYSAGGYRFLTELTTGVASGEPAMMILTTQPEHYDRIRAAVPRLVAFANVVEQSVQTDSVSASQLKSIVVNTQDSDDSGWIIAVSFELSAPINREATFDIDPAATGAMQLTESVQTIESDNEPPMGAIISFTPDAFTFTQEAAAFAAATLAAQLVVGRVLQPGERLMATRGLYYT